MAGQNKSKQEHLKCPYCDEDIAALQYPYCNVCKVELSLCPSCGKPVGKTVENCPACGAEVKCQ